MVDSQVVPSGLPPSPFRLRSGKLLDLPCQQKSQQVLAFSLSRQVSRLRLSGYGRVNFSTFRANKKASRCWLFVVPSGLPPSPFRLRSGKLLDLPGQQKSQQSTGFLLSRQVSNLNSSDPESDVLPITPRDNFEVANIKKILKNINFMEY